MISAAESEPKGRDPKGRVILNELEGEDAVVMHSAFVLILTIAIPLYSNVLLIFDLPVKHFGLDLFNVGGAVRYVFEIVHSI